jgi:hypothetical protein
MKMQVSINTNGAGLKELRSELRLVSKINVNVSAVGSVITVDTNLDLNQIIAGFDFGVLGSNFQFSPQLALAASNVDFGTITNPGTISLDLGAF